MNYRKPIAALLALAGALLLAPAAQADPTPFSVTGFDGGAFQQNGAPLTLAGSRPFKASTEFSVSTVLASDGKTYPAEELKDVTTTLPPGLVGNPLAYPTCTQQQLITLSSENGSTSCPPESQVGLVRVCLVKIDQCEPAAVYNMQRPTGTAASRIGTPGLFAFAVLNTATEIYAKVRTGEDYGLTVITKNAPQTLSIFSVHFTFWGVPADPSHDPERLCFGEYELGCTITPTPPLRPFISLPTSCIGSDGFPGGAVETFLDATSWQGGEAGASFLSHDNSGNPIGPEGCDAVPFEPTLSAHPTTILGDAPSGLDVDLQVPQNEEPCDAGPPVSCPIATAHLKDTTVTLPPGLVVNPASANGLGACSPAQFGYTGTDAKGVVHTTPEVASCPDAARLGSVEVESPAVDHPLEGSVYIAAPHQNPFGSLLALYITIDDPQTGIVAKLAGKVSADPANGQLTATFENNPQLPFEHFRLHFFGGAGGSLRTPALCGTYTTTSSLTPWSAPDSGPPASPSDPWTISGDCAQSAAALPNSPSFDAGTVAPLAHRFSPFVVHLRRNDGSQTFSALNITPPPGLVAKLAGTAICSEGALAAAAAKSGAQETASPSCPLASKVGAVTAGAGAGPAPYYAHGALYLAGPYKGAPLSFAAITPATAGPFDLGTIVVRAPVYVDPRTAQVSTTTDPIPQILQGIPLDVRSLDISLDRPDFTQTGTSCDPSAVRGSLISSLGQLTSLGSRFQLAECTRLGFKPKMSLFLKGATKRGGHPALTVVLRTRPGDANIASLSLAMPRSEFLDQAHIRTICTRVQFAADACPPAAVYGEARVETPILDYPLSGHVYLRSSDNTLPDLVPDLRGPAYQPLKVESAGRTDSIRGGIRNTFDFIPDAPFTKLLTQLQGANKGLLVNSRDICAETFRATVKYTAHNGMTYTDHPALKAKCGQSRHHKRRAR